MSTASRLCSGGLKRPKSAVKTVNARSMGAATVISWRMVVPSAVVMTLLRAVFDGVLVGGERAGPERVELAAQLRQPVAVDLVDAAVPVPAVDHQPRVLEHLEVLGDRGP